jgi:hypothetical protein
VVQSVQSQFWASGSHRFPDKRAQATPQPPAAAERHAATAPHSRKRSLSHRTEWRPEATTAARFAIAWYAVDGFLEHENWIISEHTNKQKHRQQPLYTEIYRKNATAQNLEPHFVRACAIEMHFDVSQESLYTEIYRKNAATQIHAAAFVRVCAVETHVKMSQEPLYMEIYR